MPEFESRSEARYASFPNWVGILESVFFQRSPAALRSRPALGLKRGMFKPIVRYAVVSLTRSIRSTTTLVLISENMRARQSEPAYSGIACFRTPLRLTTG